MGKTMCVIGPRTTIQRYGDEPRRGGAGVGEWYEKAVTRETFSSCSGILKFLRVSAALGSRIRQVF